MGHLAHRVRNARCKTTAHCHLPAFFFFFEDLDPMPLSPPVTMRSIDAALGTLIASGGAPGYGNPHFQFVDDEPVAEIRHTWITQERACCCAR
jgi:hypothetical protein